jgi:hypothetical protein
MAVDRESLARRYPILVDDAQAAESHMRGVAIAAEREAVAAVEPTQLGAAASIMMAYCNQFSPSFLMSPPRLIDIAAGRHIQSRLCAAVGIG